MHIETWRHYATRLNSFRTSPDGEKRSVSEALALMATVEGLSATELNYAQHVTLDDPSAIAEARGHGLDVTALNMRYDPPRFSRGAFTNPDPAVREDAIRLTLDAVDLAAAQHVGHVIVWPGPDGIDLPFQANYAELWDHQVEGIRRVARHNPAVRISIEYKPSDPRRVSLVGTMAESLLCAADTGEPNVGATLDFCHSLMAGEQPAMAASLALGRGKLFGLHLNDGYGQADDGLMVGSVHHRQLVELLWTLDQHDWDGTIYFDTFPADLDPVQEALVNIAAVERAYADLAAIDEGRLRAAQERQDAIAAQRLLLGLDPRATT